SATSFPPWSRMRRKTSASRRRAGSQATSRSSSAVSPGRSRRKPRRTWTSSARKVRRSRARLEAPAAESRAATARTRAKADPAYQAVSRAARDHGRRSGPLFEDIADPPGGVDQLPPERAVHLGAEPADVDVDHVGVAVEVHVPYLLGDQGAGEHL